jgi:hypothetical protein
MKFAGRRHLVLALATVGDGTRATGNSVPEDRQGSKNTSGSLP